jgi:predicted HAD superfamily Cof-like phosphohydrolase
MSTRSEKVKIFTEESLGEQLPTHPRRMTRKEVLFVVKMNCEELQELLATVTEEGECTRELLTNIVKHSQLPTVKQLTTDEDYIKEQVDAFVDIDYYNCNAAAKVGFNVDQIFDVVHEANMAKKFDDMTFHRNESGKVIKPPNWKEPDLDSIINNWVTNGTWGS